MRFLNLFSASLFAASIAVANSFSGAGAPTSGDSGSSAGAAGPTSNPAQAPNNDGGAGATEESATGTGTTGEVGNSGIIRSPDDSDDVFDRGDAAPRTEPEIVPNDLNTTPRVPPAPGDIGGAGGTTGIEGGTDDGVSGAEPGVINDRGTVDREFNRVPNGTDGSRRDIP